jgi:hypothetical protein
LSDASVIEFGAEGCQTGFDVAQAFAPRQLGEGRHEKLFVSGEFADTEVAVVTGDTLVELIFGQMVEELGEDGATFVHKVKNRRNAGSHPQEIAAKLKSKKDETAKTHRFYRFGIAVTGNLTGQQCPEIKNRWRFHPAWWTLFCPMMTAIAGQDRPMSLIIFSIVIFDDMTVCCE